MKEQPAVSPSYDILSKIRQVAPELYALDRKSLINNDFRFPVEKFAESLAQQFGVEVSIHVDTSVWVTEEELQKEKETLDLELLGCSMFSVPCPFSFLFPKDVMSHLLSALIKVDLSATPQPQEFIDAFQAFFFSTVLTKAKESTGWKNISLQLIEQSTLEKSTGFFISRCTVRVGSYTFSLIVALPPAFLDGLKEIAKTLEFGKESWFSLLPIIPLSLEAGRTKAPLRVLESLRAGDVLLIDSPFFIPKDERARIIITYRGVPLFHAKVKNGVIKLLEMSQTQETFQPCPYPVRETTMATTEENPEATTNTSEEKQPVQTASTPPIAINDLPLTVVVQIKELSMTIEQLKSLQVGNLLDLDIHPEESTVQLVVQGHSIAEGDLIALGDKLGVRIRTVGTTST